MRPGLGEDSPGSILRQLAVRTHTYPEHVVSQGCDSHYSPTTFDLDPVFQRLTPGHASENN